MTQDYGEPRGRSPSHQESERDAVKTHIGAMSVGDILDRGLKLLLARLPLYYAINLIVMLPYLLVELALPALQGRISTSGTASAAMAAGFLLAVVVLMILRPIGVAATLHIVSQEFVDQHASMGSAFQFAFQRFGRLLLASVLAGLIIGLGFMLCVVPGILFAIWYVFVGQVVVVEGLGGTDALARSKDLTAGYRMRVCGMFLLFLVIGLVIGFVAGLLNSIIPNYALRTIIATLLNIFVETYAAICWTLFYFDLRIRKEGFDLELAARQQQLQPV